MISRADTVNLSNMSITSEEIYEPKTTKVEDPSVEALFSALTTQDSPEAQWKISKFQITPPVRRHHLGGFLNQKLVYRCLLIWLLMPMDVSRTWKAPIRVL
jgi:aminopeptidase 2